MDSASVTVNADSSGIDIDITFRGHNAGAAIPVENSRHLSDQALFSRLRHEINKALDFYEELHITHGE